jgi:beta-xylosidase
MIKYKAMKLFLILIAELFIACSPQQKKSGNPILPNYHADPSARVINNEVWIFPSHDVTGSKYYWEMVDWHAFSSSDLVNWKDHGPVFSLAQTKWAKRYAWAPDAIERNGKYYFYFCASDTPGKEKNVANCLGIAVANAPEGPYKDVFDKPFITSSEARTTAMDPCVFKDDDGSCYLYFGQVNLKMAKLNDDMISFGEELHSIEAKGFHEGIYMHRYKNKYYLSYPEFDGVNAGKLAYSMSDSPYGPFEYKGVILDNKSRNVHHSIIEFKKQWYLFYHIQGPSAYERQVCAEFLAYNVDGTIKPIEMTQTGIFLTK